MRIATILLDGEPVAAVVAHGRVLPVRRAGLGSVREIAARGPGGLAGLATWARAEPAAAWLRF